jgi:hypothetical protein
MARRTSDRKVTFGPEEWRSIGRESFTFWDRWFLVAAIDEGGFDALAEKLMAEHPSDRDKGDLEAKLSHLVDLRKRLDGARLSPRDVLVEPIDKPLLRKAQTKLFAQSAEDRYKTRAMVETPRWRLKTRALRGHWSAFPVSPAEFAPIFERELRGIDVYDWRTTPRVEERIARLWDALTRDVRFAPARGLALHRALMTVLVEAMALLDDSGGDIARLFAEVFVAYVGVPWDAIEIAPEAYVRDGVEFGTWEDYGLIDDTGPFFGGIPPEHGPLIESVLAETLSELRQHEFGYCVERLFDQWASFVVEHDRLGDFVELAHEIGSAQWVPIVRLVDAADKLGGEKLALAVFQAANRPGPRLHLIQDECRRRFGCDLPEYRASLKLVK